MSLPLAFETTLVNVPAPARALRYEMQRVARWDALRARAYKPKVGLVWSGNPQNVVDQHRSMGLAEMLARLPTGYEYYRLQRDVRDHDVPALASSSISADSSDVRDFLSIASLSQCMDVVITVDTSIAHLSATFGRPTWVLLPFVPDWRWLRDRDDSPWYPSVRLFRQEKLHDWSEVLERVRLELCKRFPVAPMSVPRGK